MTAPREAALLMIPVVLFGALILCTPPREDDIWWRLHTGANITRESALPSHNRYSYTAPAREWVDHAWAFDLTVFGLHRLGGMKSVRLVSLFLLFTLALLLLRPERHIDLIWALPAALLLLSHHALRPWLVSDLFFLTAIWLARRRHGELQGSLIRELLLVGGLFLVWSNVHGSAVAGALLYSALSFRGFAAQHFRRWSLLSGTAGLALLCTPYGYHMPLLAVRYMTGAYDFLAQLEEWGRPTLPLAALLLLFTAGLLYRWGKKRPAPLEALVLGGLLLFSFKSRRHIPLYVIAGIMVATRRHGARLLFRKQELVTLAIFGALALGVTLSRNPAPEPRFYPATLFEAATPHITTMTPVFTTHAAGGALIYHFKGRARPYIDARNDCYPKRLFACYRAIRTMAPEAGRCLDEAPPDLVLLPPGDSTLGLFTARGCIKVWERKEHGTILTCTP